MYVCVDVCVYIMLIDFTIGGLCGINKQIRFTTTHASDDWTRCENYAPTKERR